jgi:hypothetical protein
MKVTIEIEIYDKEPRYLGRSVANKARQVATGNPKELGHAITKLLENRK